MELFGNTFFWLFFFMIGFVATLELIEDLGAAYATKIIHRTVQTAWLVVGYVLIIILFIRMLRLFGTTYTWTANALRDGTLIYISTKFKNRHAFLTLMALVLVSFYPYWHGNWWALTAFIGTLGLLVLINYFREWIRAKQWRLFIVTSGVSLIFWLFNMYAYQYKLAETLSITACFIVVMEIAYLYDRLLIYRKKRTRELLYDTQHDALTGVHSVKKFSSDFTRYRQLLLTGQSSAVHLVMIDIDHFKQINDTHGHLVGDEVLRAFAQHCDAYLDQALFPCNLYRTGGEEFSIIVTDGASDAQVKEIVENYCQALKNFSVQSGKQQIQITISAGITQIQGGDIHNNTVIERADTHLYEAKRAGRNRVFADE